MGAYLLGGTVAWASPKSLASVSRRLVELVARLPRCLGASALAGLHIVAIIFYLVLIIINIKVKNKKGNNY